MSEPHDRIDDWLTAEVEPLAPPPGTFERIRQRARRRRVSRAVMSAAGIVIVIAAGVAVPRIATTLQSHGGRVAPPVAGNSPQATVHPSVTGQGTGGVSYQSSSPVQNEAQPASLLTPGSVPKNFQPTSVTFIGLNTGAVIGQAGTAGHCASQYCTSLAGTTDYGQKWFGVSAPRTGAPDGPWGVGQLRFLNIEDGWAFGPQLWVTDDGGAHWKQEQTYGMRVTDLETAGNRAFALFATCTGSGPDFGADCSGFSLYTSAAGSQQWQPVSGPTASLPQAGTGQPGSASLVLAGSHGYLLAPSGELFSGPLTGAAWTKADVLAPCLPGPPGPAGQPTGALLAAGSDRLFLVCNSKTVMQSPNGGTSWSTAGDAPSAGIATSVAAAQGNVVVLATDSGLYLSRNDGTSWQPAKTSAAGELGFSYVGMTSSAKGVALPANPDLHEVFITTDGGSTWQPYPVSKS
jgi:photosystem II stability/assembly factor-like uncharacterized protein